MNGKVERVQKNMLIEFHAAANLDDPKLWLRLAEWQDFYHWFRAHGSIGTTLNEKLSHQSDKTPYWEDVEKLFDPNKEYIRALSYC